MSTQILPVGLTSSGKSTFTAALWYVVERGGVGGALLLRHLNGDTEYLNRIRDQWLRFQRQERTSGPTVLTRMALSDPDGAAIDLVLPDLPGEVYDSLWETRGWTEAFDNLVRGTGGLLLFVNAGAGGSSPLIWDVIPPGDGADEGLDSETAESDLRTWSHELSRPQVKIVENLQVLADRLPRRPTPVALVVSAWDLVVTEAAGRGRPAPTPWEFVCGGDGFPLLAQYLVASPDLYRTRAFGVSAQGGDLDRDLDRLHETLEPAERISVVDDSGSPPSHDITSPIRWLSESLGEP